MKPAICRQVASIAMFCAVLAAQTALPAAQGPAGPSLIVFVQGHAVGRERVTVTRSAEGWVITGASALDAPFNLTLRKIELVYDAEWRPQSITLDGTLDSRLSTLFTRVSGGQATSAVTEAGSTTTKTDTISERAILLPSNFFGAYEALALQLAGASPGAELRAYVVPQAELVVSLDAVSTERIQVPGRVIQARRHQLTFRSGSTTIATELWSDESNRLVRLTVPSIAVDVLRDDIASVAARHQMYVREGDSDVRITANGFSLAGTISVPTGSSSGRQPAVVLVAGSGTADRDETVASVPVFGLLAGALADQGFVVLRYDRRGIGQSGGRTESATLGDYAEDARAAVKWLASRRDVDRKRIALVGHGEGAAVALIAASRDKQIAALALVAGPGSSGAELLLEQQQLVLGRSSLSDADRQARMDLQKRIHQAVLTGQGWDDIPPQVRRQADTPWFRSLLSFNPAEVVSKVRQPILVAHGEVDRQIPVHHADALAALANQRKKAGPTVLVKVPNVNHQLLMAVSGELDEIGKLDDKTLSADMVRTVADWLKRVLRAGS